MRYRMAMLAGLCSLFTAFAAEARDLVVTASTSPDYQPGLVIDGSKQLTLRAGTRITLIGDDGKVVTIEGPFAGVPDGHAGGSGDNPAMVTAISRLFTQSQAENKALGAVRGTPMHEPDVDVPGDVWAINVFRSHTQCVLAGVLPTLWRPDAGRDVTVVLQQVSTQKGGLVRFPTSVQAVSWPASVPLEDGADYLARDADDTWSASLHIQIVPENEASSVHRVAWMADHGCPGQARALLANLP